MPLAVRFKLMTTWALGLLELGLLELGLAREAPLQATPEPGDAWLLINSLGCRPLRSVDDQALELHHDAEALWQEIERRAAAK